MASSSKPVDPERIEQLERQLKRVTEQLAAVVAELRARKVLPEAQPGKRRHRVKMSPAARAAQRRQLLDEARRKRWLEKEGTASKTATAKPKKAAKKRSAR